MAKRSLTVVDVSNQTEVAAASRAQKSSVAKKTSARKVTKNARKKSASSARSFPAKTKNQKLSKTTKTRAQSTLKKSTRLRKKPAKSPKKTSSKRSRRKTVSVEPLRSDPAVLKGIRRDPLGHLVIEKLLREVGFRGLVSTDKFLLDAYSTDESIFSIRPQVVLQPANARDVEIAVGVIARETKQFGALSLTPRAAGTGLSGGALTDSAVIDVSHHLKKIGEPKKKDKEITITCEPGANFAAVEKVLKTVNAYIPPAPASKDICTIGGAVANNAGGPDSLRHGHMADWVTSLNVVLSDGKTHTIEPLSYKEFQALVKKDDGYARIVKEVFALIEKNEKTITTAKPQTQKNTAGFALWDVIDTSVKEFTKGQGTFNLIPLISGSQGTLGIITSLTLRVEPIPQDTSLIILPIFDLECAGRAVLEALKYDPINIEIFDGLTFDLALKNPDFFKERISKLSYYKVMFKMYFMYHVGYRRKIPEFTLMVTLTKESTDQHTRQQIVTALQSCGCNVVRFVKEPEEREMWWQIRRASYSLSKMLDLTKRPAAFLEDMTVPPHNLFGFFREIKSLFKKYNITAAIHGHGGNGHFHFYPLMDFNKKDTAKLIEKMSEEFFTCAIKHGGSICGEHNDGIIRTPHLSKMFSRKVLDLFKELEHIFDPDDIFNPGKKVNPRFNIRDSIRNTN